MMWKYEIVVYIFEVFFSIIQLVAALVLLFLILYSFPQYMYYYQLAF